MFPVSFNKTVSCIMAAPAGSPGQLDPQHAARVKVPHGAASPAAYELHPPLQSQFCQSGPCAWSQVVHRKFFISRQDRSQPLKIAMPCQRWVLCVQRIAVVVSIQTVIMPLLAMQGCSNVMQCLLFMLLDLCLCMQSTILWNTCTVQS